MSALKSLTEQRIDKVTEMEKVIAAAKGETRAMTEDEQKTFETLEKEISAIDATIDKEERARNLSDKKASVMNGADGESERKFDAYIKGRGTLELRADEQSTSLNENIIPSEFSSDIIRKVVELSGIFNTITRVNSKGTYKQIIENTKITAGWTPELSEVMKSTADFSIVEIGHHKLGSLVKLSYEIINQAEFSIVNEVTSQMIDAFVYKTEEGVIKGTGNGQPTGLMSGGTAFDLASDAQITADELIKALHALKAPFIPNAKWLMNRETLCGIRLIKDANDRYLFHEAELTSGYAGYILGKPVMLTELMPDYQFMFGDFTRAYKANVNPQMTIQRLNEKYVEQGAVGIIGFLWFDGRPVNDEAYIVGKKTVI